MMGKIVLGISSFVIAFFGITELTPLKLGLNPTIGGWITNFLFLFVIYNCRKTLFSFFRGEYRLINIFTVLYCIWIVFSSYKNQDGSDAALYMEQLSDYGIEGQITEVKRAFWISLKVFTTVLFFETISKNNQVEQFLKIAFYVVLIYTLFVDIYTFMGKDRNEYGGKFIVLYLNLYLTVIYFRLHPNLRNKSKLFFILFLSLTACVGLYTGCSTIIVTLIPFVFLTFCDKKYFSFLYNPLFFLITLIICDGILFFFSSWLLSFDFVETFIVDVLNEDMTLTGRLGIYGTIGEVFYDSPWYGLGIGNYMGVSMVLTGCANAQNGIVNLFLEVGLVGCVIFVCWLMQLIKHAKRYRTVTYPIVAFVYAELVVSMVEIPFSYIAFLIMSSFLLLHSKSDLVISKR